jgi:hypothetical protein
LSPSSIQYSLCELWHKRMGQLHHRALPILKEIVTGLLEFNIEQHGVCRGCMLGKYVDAAFPINEHRSKESNRSLDFDDCLFCSRSQKELAFSFSYGG